MSESSAKLTIIVATNLIVSGTIVKRGNPFALLQVWQAHLFMVLLASDQRLELLDVFSRDHIIRKYHLTQPELTELFGLIAVAPGVEPAPTIPVQIRDVKDEHILAAA